MVRMLNSAILVLLYDKEISDSKTLSSLATLESQFKNAKLVIWNNGPKKLKSTDVSIFVNLGYQVQVEQTLHNESLAVIYNSFIKSNQAEKYVLLDDDSQLNSDYINFSELVQKERVAMPIISFNGSVVSPTISKVPVRIDTSIKIDEKVITIGSGLVIGSDVVIELESLFGEVFDERFYFYGVDTSFCFRIFLSGLNKSIEFIPGFAHSLSRLQSEDSAFTNFRCNEHSYSLGMMLKYYYSKPKALLVFMKVFFLTVFNRFLRKRGLYKIRPLVRAIYTGKHYRD